jgi:hypothetical protein
MKVTRHFAKGSLDIDQLVGILAELLRDTGPDMPADRAVRPFPPTCFSTPAE